MTVNFVGFEGDLETRIKEAKAKAKRVYYNTSESLDEETLRLQFILAKHYNMPIFDKYFDSRTIDDLIFEIELLKLATSSDEEKMEDIVTKEENRKELEGLFDDWAGPVKKPTPKKPAPTPEPSNGEPLKKTAEKTEENAKWVDVPGQISDDQFLKQAEAFMKSGEFITGEEDGDK